MDNSNIFIFKPFWNYYGVTESEALQLIKSYLGPSRVFTDIEKGVKYLRNVLEQVQNDIKTIIRSTDYITAIGQIYSIFDRTFRHYIDEKQERTDID